MYTRDTAFSTWPTNCTGQQRGAQLSAFGSAWLQETSMHKSLQRLLLLQKIIFGKKTSFLEIIDYYTILYAPSNIPPPWSIIQSSPATGCCYWDRILLRKRSGSPQFNASDRWLTCMQCKYRRRRGADRRRRALSDHQMLWRASYCFPFVHHGNNDDDYILYEKCIGHLRLLIIIIIECGLRKGDRKETPKSI